MTVAPCDSIGFNGLTPEPDRIGVPAAGRDRSLLDWKTFDYFEGISQVRAPRKNPSNPPSKPASKIVLRLRPRVDNPRDLDVTGGPVIDWWPLQAFCVACTRTRRRLFAFIISAVLLTYGPGALMPKYLNPAYDETITDTTHPDYKQAFCQTYMSVFAVCCEIFGSLSMCVWLCGIMHRPLLWKAIWTFDMLAIVVGLTRVHVAHGWIRLNCEQPVTTVAFAAVGAFCSSLFQVLLTLMGDAVVGKHRRAAPYILAAMFVWWSFVFIAGPTLSLEDGHEFYFAGLWPIRATGRQHIQAGILQVIAFLGKALWAFWRGSQTLPLIKCSYVLDYCVQESSNLILPENQNQASEPSLESASPMARAMSGSPKS
eukprot:TRINITY_DN65671_c0_g1_i1.p1 TRINITY_DN65671_c0_g1~~TRINITY_DN65671_c0_g1_i1.p1  ORF type:complete len:398 (+),score=7.84 TRINITY_DN65671_c0_g1_i1:86-1195(+)